MTTSIAEYYLDELYDWKSAIELYIEGIDESTEWLKTILKLDSVPALAANVEHYLSLLQLSRQNLNEIKSSIGSSERKLYANKIPVTNETLSEQVRKEHTQLRRQMHIVEKAYLDVKYECDEYLANLVDFQNRIKSSGHI